MELTSAHEQQSVWLILKEKTQNRLIGHEYIQPQEVSRESRIIPSFLITNMEW